jgi:hypothetical protein
MKKREICAAALLLCAAGVFGVLNYIVFYRPMFVQPELDRTF